MTMSNLWGCCHIKGTVEETGNMEEENYSIEVEIVPDEQVEGNYICKLIIRDMESDDIIVSPILTVNAKEEGTARIGTSEESLTFKVIVDHEKGEAVYKIEMSESGKVIYIHNARIEL